VTFFFEAQTSIGPDRLSFEPGTFQTQV